MAAERRLLTVEVVKAQRPGPADRIIWDTKVPRFGLRVRPTGGKVYVLRMRVDGRQRWYTIGAHGDPWTPDTAREEASRVLGQAVHVVKLRETGQAPPTLRHPIEARERRRAAPTLTAFAERYLEDHARPHKRPASLREDEGNLKRAILPELGDLRIDAITSAEVTSFHLGRKDTPTNANRCLALLSHMMTKAEQWGLRPQGSNPCRYVQHFPETKRERFLSPVELGRLGKALTRLEQSGSVTAFGLAAIRLLVFIGARASEILGLTWDAVDTAAGLVRVPAKRGVRTLVLNAPASEVLAKLPRVEDNPYVIVGRRRRDHLTLAGLEQVWKEVRKTAQFEDVRLHDLRHSFASVAVAGGTSLPIIGGLLGHTHVQTTNRYAHLAADPLRVASEAVGRAIISEMEKRPSRRGRRATTHGGSHR